MSTTCLYRQAYSPISSTLHALFKACMVLTINGGALCPHTLQRSARTKECARMQLRSREDALQEGKRWRAP